MIRKTLAALAVTALGASMAAAPAQHRHEIYQSHRPAAECIGYEVPKGEDLCVHTESDHKVIVWTDGERQAVSLDTEVLVASGFLHYDPDARLDGTQVEDRR